MAYFSNSTMQDEFECAVCVKCVHYPADETICPVMFAHFVHQADDRARWVLDMLIEPQEGSFSCKMFIEVKGEEGA